MLVLEQLTTNELNVELLPDLTDPFWLFVFELEDLNGQIVSVYLTPSWESTRFYTFSLNTTTTPLKTGTYLLSIYEMPNGSTTTDVTGLTPKYISKARIYETFPADNFNTITLTDERID